MKKTLFLLGLVFMLSGCTVNYDLEIFNEEYKEKITINSVDVTSDMEKRFTYEIPVHFDEPKVDSIETTKKIAEVVYYEKNKITKETTNEYVYTHNFKMEDYYKSYFVNSSFDFFAVYYNDKDDNEKDLVTISTNFKMKIFETYPDIDEININIKTNHKVKLSNADSNSNFTYTWKYTKDNYKDKAIQLVLYKDKYVFNYDGKLYRVLIMFGSITVLVLTTCVILIRKSKKANKV